MDDYGGRAAKELRSVFPRLDPSALIPCPVSAEQVGTTWRKSLPVSEANALHHWSDVFSKEEMLVSRKSTLGLKGSMGKSTEWGLGGWAREL